MKYVAGGIWLTVAGLIISVGLWACFFQAAGQPFPTAAQMLAACKAEKAAGTPQERAPDCLAWWTVAQGCGVQAVMNAANPIVIPVATAGNPLAGSLISMGASLNTAVCKQQGFLK